MNTELKKIVKKLSRKKLIDLLAKYDRYIQNANDENLYKEKWYPVCIAEFYDCEYQLPIKCSTCGTEHNEPTIWCKNCKNKKQKHCNDPEGCSYCDIDGNTMN